MVITKRVMEIETVGSQWWEVKIKERKRLKERVVKIGREEESESKIETDRGVGGWEKGVVDTRKASERIKLAARND